MSLILRVSLFSFLFSIYASSPTIKAHAQPFPIILANAIPPALIANPNDPAQIADTIPGNSVPVGSEIWEINMCEFFLSLVFCGYFCTLRCCAESRRVA